MADAGPNVPTQIRQALIGTLFGSLPVFFGGAFNTILISAVIAVRTQRPAFVIWFAFEIVVCLARLAVLLIARRAALAGRKTPTDLYVLLGLAWSCGVGYGIVVSMASGDWLVACVACLSGAAMVGGICMRNFGAPRFATAMMLTSIGPSLIGAALSGELLMSLVFIQAPMYVVAMAAAAFKFNKMLVSSMLAERENDHRARHDALTGLSNRHGLVNAANASLAAARDGERSLSLLFVDLDGFKAVNDTFGHAAGDALLKLVAERLRRMLRADDIAARIGGDEFVTLVNDRDPAATLAFAEQLIAEVSSTYDLGGGATAHIGLSIGIAMAPHHGATFEDLLAAADAALYEAKSQGKCRCCMASVTANVAALQRLSGRPSSQGAPVAAA
ncbi:MAG TPA: GGDEF domain-containing protein [Pseudolabrys sp.]|nr:GGDEF domain-containing protein [Pseudolabrys sp.]